MLSSQKEKEAISMMEEFSEGKYVTFKVSRMPKSFKPQIVQKKKQERHVAEKKTKFQLRQERLEERMFQEEIQRAENVLQQIIQDTEDPLFI